MAQGTSRGWFRSWRDATWWALLLMMFWWLLSDGADWLVGTALVVCGTGVAVWLRLSSFRLNWIALPRFLAFFLRELLAGAIDVALRALLPKRKIAPRWIVYPLQPGSAAEHLLLSLMIGLLPGTFASHVDGDHLHLHLHVLDVTQAWRPVVEQLEAHLLRLGGRSA